MQRKTVLQTVVLRLIVVVTAISTLVVVLGATAIWLLEGDRPDTTFRSWGDALWWSLCTLTTVGYGDHVPVTTAGRLVATGVMVLGVAVIGAVAAIVALAVTLGWPCRKSASSRPRRRASSDDSRRGSIASRRS
jgi:voltage-gated potassium channel